MKTPHLFRCLYLDKASHQVHRTRTDHHQKSMIACTQIDCHTIIVDSHDHGNKNWIKGWKQTHHSCRFISFPLFEIEQSVALSVEFTQLPIFTQQRRHSKLTQNSDAQTVPSCANTRNRYVRSKFALEWRLVGFNTIAGILSSELSTATGQKIGNKFRRKNMIHLINRTT